MDRKLLYGAILFLIIQVFILLGEINLIPFKLFSYDDPIKSTTPIGTITETKQKVRRRSSNTIFWENSKKSDSVYNYDSILTLENSTSEIQLKGNIKLQLHENTLVVLEPQEDEVSGAFKIKFQRGDLRSTNTQKLKLGATDWILEAQSNTDMSIKNTTGDNLELEVFSGEVVVKNKKTNQSASVKSDTKAILKKELLDKKEISSDFNFTNKSYQRIYAHKFPVNIDLSWLGNPEYLNIVTPQKSEQRLDITNQFSYKMALEPGSYYFNLESNSKISKSISIHVWPAPRIHYYYPLPRDRIQTRKTSLFSWSKLDIASSYELRFSNDEKFNSESQITNYAIQGEGELEWFVYGRDDLGFEIPPLYGYPIYSVPEPLAPPELIDPQLREPANDTENSIEDQGWLNKIFHLLIPSAQAQVKDHYLGDIIFEWKTVPGADTYNIEISSKPDFINPEIIARTDSTKFVWQNYTQDVYYWRVAGGQKSGRMGLFSNVQKLDLKNLSRLKGQNVSPGVKLVQSPLHKNAVKVAKAPPPPVKTSTPDTLPINSAPLPITLSPATPKPEITNENPAVPTATNSKLNIGYGILYYFGQKKNSQNTIANFNGLQPFNLLLNLDVPVSSGSIMIKTNHYYAEWKPNPSSSYPFQNKVKEYNLDFLAGHKSSGSPWFFALKIEKENYPVRIDFEKISLENRYYYGFFSSYNIENSIFDLKSTHGAGLAFGKNYEFQIENDLKIPIPIFNKIYSEIIYKLKLRIYFGDDHQSGFMGQTGVFLNFEF